MPREAQIAELLSLWEEHRQEGRSSSPEDLCKDQPELLEGLRYEIERQVGKWQASRSEASTVEAAVASGPRVAAVPLPQIKGYEVLEQVGRGGMGVVYRARQTRLNRVVALKMILTCSHARPGELARFLAEAEAVAQLEHPNLVRLYEVGQHDGLPYFTMEFVPGGSLSRRLDGTPLPARQAAELVRQLAHGMHYAHRRGIVHRDLKPSNVLLSGETTTGESAGGSSLAAALACQLPKITDFGLAKRVETHSGMTAPGAILGTPSYMAPEQAEDDKAVGPAADIYALGATLYECLTGRPPFRGPTPLETMKQVVSQEPVPPSRLNPSVPRDLETICLKCLRKEPNQRYGSAQHLAEDLRRWLAGEPIMARPAGRLERTWRWCQRNPRVASLAAALLLVIILSGAGLLGLYLLADSRRLQAERVSELARQAQKAAEREHQNAEQQKKKAEDNERHARLEAKKAKDLSDLLVGVFESADPIGMQGYTFGAAEVGSAHLSALEIVKRAENRARAADVDSASKATQLDSIGNVYRVLGQYNAAQKLLEDAYQMRLKTLGADHDETADSLFNLGWLHHDRGRYLQAADHYHKCLALRQRLLGPAHPKVTATLFNQAWLLAEMGDYKKAESLFKEVGARRLKQHGTELHRDVAVAKAGLAALYLEAGEYLKASGPALQAQAIFAKLSPNDRIAKAVGRFQTAVVARFVTRQYGWAEKELRQCLADTKSELGDNHNYVTLVAFQLAEVLEVQKKFKEAEQYYRECLAIARANVGLGHPKMVALMTHLSGLLSKRPDGYDEAAELFEKVLHAHEDRFGSDHPLVANVLLPYAELVGKRSVGEEIEMLQRAVDIYAVGERKYGMKPAEFKTACRNLSSACRRAQSVSKGLEAARQRQVLFAHDPQELFDTACELAFLVRVAENDNQLSEAQKEGLMTECVGQALAVLTKAVATGFDDPFRLLADPRVDSISGRPEFESLLQRWPAFDRTKLQITRDHLDATCSFDTKLKASRHKVKVVQLEAGKAYQIDLLSADFDAYLRLENEAKKELKSDDDSGGDLNSRITFNPPQSGTYRIIITTFRANETGRFVLVVQQKE